MELTLAEFAIFNQKSKRQILQTSAVLVSNISLANKDLLYLYVLNKHFITMQVSSKASKVVHINTRVTTDVLYLFAEKTNLSNLIN